MIPEKYARDSVQKMGLIENILKINCRGKFDIKRAKTLFCPLCVYCAGVVVPLPEV